MNVFISYGHDEHAELVRRIASDLSARGHTIWIDEQRIHEMQDWSESIERGVAASEIVVAFISPHALRRPDGVCLKELSLAGFQGKRIAPVLLRFVPLPLSISNIQWLDMQGWKDPASGGIREEWYRERFERLVAAIDGKLALGFEGEQAFLRGLLDPFDNRFEIDRHTKSFVGRQWLFEAFHRWLEGGFSTRILWITGEAGAGKSALAAMLAFREPAVAGAHFCRFDDSERGDPRRVLRSLAYQLATQIPDYAAALLAMTEREKRSLPVQSSAALFAGLFLERLHSLADPGRRLVLIVDALDEAGRDGRNDLASLLGREVDQLPSWLGVVITSRPEPDLLRRLSRLEPLRIAADDERNRKDLEEYVSGRAARDANPPSAAQVRALVEKSDGSFLYAVEFFRELESGRLTWDRLESYPSGLTGVYTSFFERQFPDLDLYQRDQRPLLELVAVSTKPLPMELAGLVLGWDEYRASEATAPLGSLFPVRDGTIRPFHKSVIDWLTAPDRSGSYAASARRGGESLRETFRRALMEPERNAALARYRMPWLPTALAAAGAWDELEGFLTDSQNLPPADAFALVDRFPADRDLSRISAALVSWVKSGRAELSRSDPDEGMAWIQRAYGALAMVTQPRALVWIYLLIEAFRELPLFFESGASEEGFRAPVLKSDVIESCAQVLRRLEARGVEVPETVRAWYRKLEANETALYIRKWREGRG